jgi:hypothetical protein
MQQQEFVRDEPIIVLTADFLGTEENRDKP